HRVRTCTVRTPRYMYRDSWRAILQGVVASHSQKRSRDISLRADASCLRLPFEEAKWRVHQFFNKRHAVELDELNIRLHTAIEREAYFPRARKHLGILNCRFVLEVVRTQRPVALDHMEIRAMEIASAVEPGVVRESCNIDNQ